VPNADWNGTTTITYRAWDQSSGTAGSTASTTTNGGTSAFSSATASPSITVNAVNDAPVFSSASNFTTITEDQTNNAGNLVSSLFSSTDVDSGAVNGIALYSATPSNGTWQYSTDGGSTWTGVGSVSGSSALLLRSTDYVRFVPDAHNADSASISFYVWDQTSGTTGSKVDVSTRGSTTAFSSSSGSSSISVSAVNDAPVFVSASNFTTITEDQTNNAGNLVSSLFSSTDVDTGAANGIALYSATPSNGTWQYSIDGGSTWTGVGSVSGSSALLLRSTDYVRFVPDAHNADSASISFYVWDQSSGTAGNKIDVSARGGTTAFSSAGGTSSITVTAVNDAPVLAGSNNFTAINEDTTTSGGTLVSALISGQVTDVDTGASSGIAVTAVDNTNGAWQYTTDGGTTWTAFGTPSASTARLLTSNASTSIRFVPNANWNGTATITYRAWDQNSGTAGNTADVSSNGGTTAFSSATASPSITVNAVNDAPVATITPTTYSATEQTTLSLEGTGIAISDVDAGSASMTATLSVTSGTLSVAAGTTGAGVSGSGTNTLTLTGTITQINNLLAGSGGATLSYLINSDTPPASDTLSLLVNDNGNTGSGGALTGSDSATINIAAVNDAPVISTSVTTLSYTENDPATAIDSALTAGDVDSSNLVGVTVQITGNYANGEDVLAFSDQNGITHSWDATTGTLTLSGASSVANYQTALFGHVSKYVGQSEFGNAYSLLCRR
jgi:hypothetical protein